MPIIGVLDSAKSGNLAPSTGYISLGTTTAGTTTASITLTVPSGYSHIVVRGMMRSNYGSGVDYAKFLFNSDNTAGNYRGHNLTRYRTSGSDGLTQDVWGETQQGMLQMPGATVESNCFRSLIMTITEYASTSKLKTARIEGGYVDSNAYGYGMFSSELWKSTAAITSITFTPVLGTYFAQNTTLSLYGIK